ncbi:hypothetical protein BH20VER1_BH20VER1_26180 [soil metagenome]
MSTKVAGSEFWASIFIGAVRSENVELIQHFISLHDQTRHRPERARCEILISELNHRVKNTLATSDDGKGFDQQLKTKGMGLDNMRYRASIIRGKLTIRAQKSGGTCVRCDLPLRRARK